MNWWCRCEPRYNLRMPNIDKHPAGAFCWVELGTTDQTSAKSFYATLFGWTPDDLPVAQDEYYTLFKLNDREVAAAYTMHSEEQAVRPAHWNLYVAVDSADDSAAKAAELGGNIIAAPFDVMNFGRMAVIQDPGGAVFCVWQSLGHPGSGVAGEIGTMCWADLTTGDPERAKEFYESLFGWKIGAVEGYPPDYLVIRNGEKPIAGIPPADYEDPNVPPQWMLFFRVGDVDAVAAKAKEMGGGERLAPLSMGKLRLAVLTDPEGAAFSIIQPPAQA
jgi:predicted enzyme related to lactoylglutathione lyase